MILLRNNNRFTHTQALKFYDQPVIWGHNLTVTIWNNVRSIVEQFKGHTEEITSHNS